MINELRIYTVKPGTVADVARNSGTIARKIRGDDYGKLEGYWMTEIGPLNQVVHLWSYADLNERQRLRAELSKNTAWTGEYLPVIRPNLVRQDIRLMNPVLPLKAPDVQGSNVYELRYYRMKPGCLGEWVKHFTAALPGREKDSKIVGLGTGEARQPNEVLHLWSYPDLNARTAARAAAVKDPGWQEFLRKGGPLMDEMNCMIMLPSAHSPLK